MDLDRSLLYCIIPFHHTYSEESNYSFPVHFLFLPFLNFVSDFDYKFGLVLGAVLNTYCKCRVCSHEKKKNRNWTAKWEDGKQVFKSLLGLIFVTLEKLVLCLCIVLHLYNASLAVKRKCIKG